MPTDGGTMHIGAMCVGEHAIASHRRHLGSKS